MSSVRRVGYRPGTCPPNLRGGTTMIVTGKLLDIEHRAGDFTDKQNGGNVKYDFTVLHVLEGREVHKVRLPREIHVLDLPFSKDDEIEIEVALPKDCKLMYVGLPALV